MRRGGGRTFSDNERIEGNIANMLEEALRFVKRNMKTKTIIRDGEREDRTEYPLTAVREAVINALVHRDYSIHTEGMPIQIQMFEDRMEIRNPGGIYGRLRIDQLGKCSRIQEILYLPPHWRYWELRKIVIPESPPFEERWKSII